MHPILKKLSVSILFIMPILFSACSRPSLYELETDCEAGKVSTCVQAAKRQYMSNSEST